MDIVAYRASVNGAYFNVMICNQIHQIIMNRTWHKDKYLLVGFHEASNQKLFILIVFEMQGLTYFRD